MSNHTDGKAKPILVVDLDGTILDNCQRQIASAREAFGADWPFTGDTSVAAVLAEIERGPRTHAASEAGLPTARQSTEGDLMTRFYSVFLSDRFLSLDVPLPEALEAVKHIQSYCRVVFLTGRHDSVVPTAGSMRQGTEQWLKAQGIDSPDIVFKPRLDLCETSELRAADQAFKASALRTISEKGRILAAIGDTPDDALACLEADVVPIWFQPKRATVDKKTLQNLRRAKHPPIIVSSWQEIERVVEFLAGESSELRPIVDLYVSTYTSFHSTLDNITYLCLVTSTVALGFLFNSKPALPLSLWLTTLNVGAATFLFFSVVSCILAFLPKTSHPPKAGTPIIFVEFRRLASRLRGSVTDSQITHRMDQGRGLDKRALFVEFLETAYHTIDPVAVLCQRCFDLRLANYAKVRWISWGAVFVLLGLSCMVLSLLFQYIDQFLTPMVLRVVPR